MFHICVVAHIVFEKLCGGALATYSFVALKTKFVGFVLSAVCSYLTLFTLLGFGFLGAVDSWKDVFKSCR